MLNLEQFLPADAPLLDYLVHDTRRPEGWKYPKLKDLESYQSNQGLNLGMLKEIEVRELVCGVSSEEEMAATREWVNRMHDMDQSSLPLKWSRWTWRTSRSPIMIHSEWQGS